METSFQGGRLWLRLGSPGVEGGDRGGAGRGRAAPGLAGRGGSGGSARTGRPGKERGPAGEWGQQEGVTPSGVSEVWADECRGQTAGG